MRNDPRTTLLGVPVRYLALRRCQTFANLESGGTWTESLQGVAPYACGSPPFYALFAGLTDGDNVLICDFPAHISRADCVSVAREIASLLAPDTLTVED